ncbi:MAG: 16S rRNA (uracil(1498)-N(3))-methyltransferase [Planctomycetes bacterium]|nr:16S rRNA (uracil(1498)-N(3))-methyltransferase [Planctomycetota bacterium]
MKRTFLCPDLPDRGPAVLPPGESRHLATVLRASPGDELRLVDGRGRRGAAKFIGMEAGVARVEVISTESSPGGSGPGGMRIGLAAAIPKGSRADWMVEKCVEAGLDVFFPILTRRGVATAEGESKRARWERIAAETAKQCGRATLPELLEPRPLAEVLELTSAWRFRAVADPGGSAAPSIAGDALVFVGPEGGWAPEEREMMKALPLLRLGPHVLRVETAAVLGVAALTNRPH